MTAVQPGLAERFAFDPAHNLLDTTVASGGRVEGNRVRVFEDKRYDYDAHGNLTEKLSGRQTRLRLEWNAAHQLVRSVTMRQAQASSPVVQTVKYVYDPFGRRIAKKDAFGTTRFCWDGNRLLSETRGTWERTYVYEPDSFVPLAQLDATCGDAGDGSESEVCHIHTDHLGTPNEVTGQDGQIMWAAEYKTWGNVLREVWTEKACAIEEPLAERVGVPIIRAQSVRFLGQFHDSETGLNYNRFRYYDADCGRYVSTDPIGLFGGTNAYQYAPNPSGWTDPLGLTKCGDCSGANKTGTVWDSVQPVGPMHPGSVIPQQFELALERGGKIWVDRNATKHVAEYAAAKAINSTPEAVRLASQVQLESLGSAVNTAVQKGLTYRQVIKVNNWELVFAPAKSADQFPALYHAIYRGK